MTVSDVISSIADDTGDRHICHLCHLPVTASLSQAPAGCHELTPDASDDADASCLIRNPDIFPMNPPLAVPLLRRKEIC